MESILAKHKSKRLDHVTLGDSNAHPMAPAAPNTATRGDSHQRLHLLEEISRHLVTLPESDMPCAAEKRLRWNSPVARGTASALRARPGLEMALIDVEGFQPWSFEMLHEGSDIELSFHRASAVRVRASCGTEFPQHRGPMMMISRIREHTPFSFESKGRGRDTKVSLFLKPKELLAMTGLEELPPSFASVLHADAPFSYHGYRLTHQMLAVVDQILACPLQGPTRKLYLESQALQLLAHTLSTLSVDSPASSRQLSRVDVERLEHAKSLLLRQISDPPSIRTLARSSGLNERKLKEGFKLHFGTTVFGFLRRERMSQAFELLRTRRQSVIEVAQLVGYANASKFAAAFKRQFGTSPSQVAGWRTTN